MQRIDHDQQSTDKRQHFPKQLSVTSLPLTYFDLINKVGSDGPYQRRMFFIFFIIYMVTGTVLLSTAFIFRNNQYQCQELGLLAQQCKTLICQIHNQSEREKYFAKNQENIISIATEFGPFMCEDEYLLDLLKSSPYFGAFLGFILFSIISDNFGRRKTMILSLGTASFGCVLLVIGQNISMITVGILLAGAGANPSAVMVFCFLGQTVQNTKRQKYSILVQSSYTLGGILLTVFYYYFQEWRIVCLLLQTIPAIAAFVLFIIYVQETPQFLLKKQNKQALRALNKIGYANFQIQDILNEADIQNVKYQQLVDEKYAQIKISHWDLINYPSLRNTTIVTCLLSSIIIGTYYGPSLIIDTIGFNMYVSNLVVLISELLGYLPCYFFINKVKRIKTGCGLFSIAIATSFVLAFVQKPNNCTICSQSIIQIVMIFFFKFGVATQYLFFLVFSIELFPARITGLGTGTANAFGTMASALMPIVLGALSRTGFNLMLFFLILGIIGLCLTLLLQQTYGKPLRAQIYQIQQEIKQFKSKSFLTLESEKINDLIEDTVSP